MLRPALSILLLALLASLAAPGAPRPSTDEPPPDETTGSETAGDETEAGDESTGPGDRPPAGEAPAEPPRRVIIQVDRYTSVFGTLELETSDVIVIRTLEDEVRSFPRTGIGRIIRLTDPKPGQQGEVRLMNGEVRVGTIVRDTYEEVIIEVEGVSVRLPRSIVDDVRLRPTFEELHAHYRATLDLDDPEECLVFCQWLVDRRRWDLAQPELERLWRMDPSPEAGQLRRLTAAQLALLEERRQPKEEPAPAATPSRPELRYPLTDAEVNLIRVYEINFRDPPRVLVPRPTVRRIIDTYKGSELLPTSEEELQRLFGARSIDLVRLLFELRARELYHEIEVLSEPPPLELFRRRVHDTWLIQNCATSDCHGGPRAGRFALYREDFRDPRVRYANFLALEQLPMTAETPLLDFQQPESSLLLQHALPRDNARRPHPDVPGFRPAFRGVRDRRFQYAVQWIRSLFQPRPAYPVHFKAPPAATASPSEAGPDR